MWTKGKVAKLLEKQHILFSSNITLAYKWVTCLEKKEMLMTE